MRVPASAASIEHAALLLAQGRLVAFPTETVYGLGARADSAVAVRAIFRAKDRPTGNPLIVHVASIDAARALAAEWSDVAERLATAFWPGPLTLVVRKRVGPGGIVDEATAFGPTVALRLPAHPVARALLSKVALPIAAPSANPSTHISPTTAEHVTTGLGDRVDLVLDGGATDFGIESTVLDVSRQPAVLLRHGAIALAALARWTGVCDAGALVVPAGERARAPGGSARHYAPNARVVLVDRDAVRAAVEDRRRRGERVGTLERGVPTVSEGTCEVLSEEPTDYARDLYAALHRLEEQRCDVIVIARVPDCAAWAAVRDRLARASA
jgi:L-threonylcarbamoyladenylate synthase